MKVIGVDRAATPTAIGTLTVGERVVERTAPATHGVLGEARLGHCHRKQPPALLWAERRPLAADDRGLISTCGLRRPRQDTEFLADQALDQVRACVPAASGMLGGLQALVEVASRRIGDGRPDGALHDCPRLVRQPGVLAEEAEVLNDEDRVLAGGGYLDAEQMFAIGSGRAEVNGLGRLGGDLRAVATHCSTSPGRSSKSNCPAKATRSWPVR